MPVTAKLSRRFYEQFGDELTNELVEWFNAVDSTYRSDLRDTNTANFARFDARLKQRVAELDAKIDRRYTELDAKIDRRCSELDAKIDQRYTELDAKIDLRFGALSAKFDQHTAELREMLVASIAGSESRMLRWMFALWTSSMLAVAGLFVAIVRFR